MNIQEFQESIARLNGVLEPTKHVESIENIATECLMPTCGAWPEIHKELFKQQAAEILRHLSLLCSSVGVDLTDIVEIAEEP